jgi:two-component system KDP operon response regulator KdpE
MSAERILVCDDDAQIRRALQLVLREAGYDVLPAATGEEALDLASAYPAHAAIIDLVLPDRHGVEVCQQLREWSDMPILVLSALDEEGMKVDALNRGADDYVTKPFSPGELVARVGAALRRARRDPEEPTIEIGEVAIDLAAHTVHVGGEEVRLTPKEFALLALLARNRGRLITHTRMLAEIWGPAYEDATPLLRTHIANLRRKLQAAGAPGGLIRTDAGIGYRLGL